VAIEYLADIDSINKQISLILFFVHLTVLGYLNVSRYFPVKDILHWNGLYDFHSFHFIPIRNMTEATNNDNLTLVTLDNIRTPLTMLGPITVSAPYYADSINFGVGSSHSVEGEMDLVCPSHPS
jgi:hypothetical protein